MGRQKTTIFATVGRGRCCGGQAFFDKCLSTCNRMAASSQIAASKYKNGGSDLLKAAASGMTSYVMWRLLSFSKVLFAPLFHSVIFT